MSGVPLILSLLLADAGVTGLVATDNIMGDELPVGTPVPAIGVTSISMVSHRPLVQGPTRFVFERVQATIFAPDRPTAKAILKAVRLIIPTPPVTYPGLTDITVHLFAAGPDFTVPEPAIRVQLQDFQTSYNEPA